MEKRVTSIQDVKLTELGSTSVFEIGDSEIITPLSKAIALQRERAVFIMNELSFHDFSIFSVPIVQPTVEENLTMTTFHNQSQIQIKEIEIFSVTSSSIVHLGSSELLHADSRIKHIRHFLREENSNSLQKGG